jgi:hypothetical protein
LGLVVALFRLYFYRWEIRTTPFGVGSKVFEKICQTRGVGDANRMENHLTVVGTDPYPVFASCDLRTNAQVAECPL